MKRAIFLLSAIFIIATVFFTNCKKDPSTKSLPGSGILGVQKNLETLSGFVVDESNLPMTGVSVSINGSTYTTGNDGFFIFYNLTVQNSRYVLKFESDDYFTIVRSGQVIDGVPVRLKVQLLPYDPSINANCDTTMFQSSNGGSISVGNLLTLNFPANNFIYESGMPYDGPVHVKAMYVDPTLNEYNYRVHGGDQVGMDFNYQKILLRAFVGGNVMLFDDNGQKLQLNPNAKANVDFNVEIPAGLINAAPSTIETWIFDENTGLRIASAGSPGNTAGKTGNKYQGALGHFSYFSCEVSYTSYATVKGTVTNTNGDPVSGVYVNVGQSFAITDQNGQYEQQVVAGAPVTVGIFPDYFGTPITPWTGAPYNTQVVNFTVPAIGLVTGQLVDCSGQPVAGHVNLYWGGAGYAQTYTTNGTFEIEIPTGVGLVDAYYYGNNTDIQDMVTIGAFPYDLGTIVLCPPPAVGPSKMTLTGGPEMFSGAVIGLTDPNNMGYWWGSSTQTHIGCYDNTGGTMDIYMMNINSTGTYPVGANVSVYFHLIDGMWSSDLSSGTVTISRYDAVGGLIEGTFSGTALDGTLVTDGQFSVVRSPDQP